MGSAVVPDKEDLCEAFLGKSWAWWQLQFLRSRVNDSYTFPLYHKVHPTRVFGNSEYVGREGAIDNLRDSGVSRIESRNAIIGENTIRRSPTLGVVRWNAYPFVNHFSHRTQQPVWNPCLSSESGCGRTMGSSLTPTDQPLPMSTPHPSTNVPYILHLHADVNVNANTDACTITDVDTDIDTIPVIDASVDALVNDDVSEIFDTIRLHIDNEAKRTTHSSTEKDDGDKDEVDGRDQDEDDGRDEEEHELDSEDEDDKDNGHDLVEEPTPVVVCKNAMHTSHRLVAHIRLDYANDLFLIYLM
ncbi:hypothetical protein Golax_018074 [Gossypium laxum]|uniref:Uncharacterized protein n=1 Tax=Gossypium laxum TaxID=34288 RepID=A0A7J8Z2F2_9ROSI|nr:hypothetical protein [Gossypium laxum]